MLGWCSPPESGILEVQNLEGLKISHLEVTLIIGDLNGGMVGRAVSTFS